MNEKINLLDHGYIRLVDHMGSDLSIVRSARISYDAEWRAGENEGSDKKLIKYLWKNKHTTPFEAVTFTFEVKAPIFVFRQWHRHRTQSYNEVSARYKELPNEYYIPKIEQIGKQSTNNKQGRELENVSNGNYGSLIEEYKYQADMAFKLYKGCIDAGWPKELARMILPVSTYSHMFTTMNLKNLLDFIRLRNHSHAQYEIRVYAEAILELIKDIVPITIEAFNEAI